jgi:aldose 1-epimerase
MGASHALDPVELTDPRGELRATVIPGAGMLIASLRAGDAELLGQRRGLEAYLRDGKTTGIPLLYPWANRLGAERFTVAGVDLDLTGEAPGLRRDPHGLPIHGLLAADPGWEIERVGDAELVASLDFGARPELLATWPFPHRLSYAVELGDGELTLSLTITATGQVAVPVAYGLHPYFTLPGVAREDWEVELPAREHLDLDSRGLPTGAATSEAATAGRLGSQTFDDAYDGLAAGAKFAVAGGGWTLRATFEQGFPAGQVFAPADDAVICFEPMAAATNAVVTGRALRTVAPGHSDTARVRVAVAGMPRA